MLDSTVLHKRTYRCMDSVQHCQQTKALNEDNAKADSTAEARKINAWNATQDNAWTATQEDQCISILFAVESFTGGCTIPYSLQDG